MKSYSCLLFCALLLLASVAPAQTIHVPTFTGSTTVIEIHKNDPSKNKTTKITNRIWLPTLVLSSTDIQQFFGSDKALSPLNQIGSAYNGASSSATVSANLVSLIFGSGWQLVVTTNVQAGSAGVTNVPQGTVPTLSASAAGQATQNMLYGGTILLAADLPLLYYGPSVNDGGGFGFQLDAVTREGIDVQNFKSGTTTSVTSPPSHHATQLETYFLYNSVNPPQGATTGFAGSIFLGGSYGYTYTSHDYARDYGFGSQVNNGVGQISAGVLITNVAKISVSRAFGPTQTYIDSTSMAQTKVNNFKAWSFAITYQTSASKPSPTTITIQ